jgi:hypothetical protein
MDIPPHFTIPGINFPKINAGFSIKSAFNSNLDINPSKINARNGILMNGRHWSRQEARFLIQKANKFLIQWDGDRPRQEASVAEEMLRQKSTVILFLHVFSLWTKPPLQSGGEQMKYFTMKGRMQKYHKLKK